MGLLETTKGNDHLRKTLLNALLHGQLPTQLLFVGPEGVGKKRVAWGLAEILLCLERKNEVLVACGHCSSCIKIQSGFHENILFIEPEKNLIKLEKAEEIQDFLSLAHDQRARIVIVNDAHALNAQASNSLLKVFEEPPPQTYFFFITHRWMQVLPTIRSRATKIPFSPLSDNDLLSWCNTPQERELLRQARGSVKELLSQKEEEQIHGRQDAHLMFKKFFSEKDYFLLGNWREEIKDKDKLILFIRHWMFLLRDIFFAPVSGGTPSKILAELPALQSLTFDELWDLWDRGLTLEMGVLGHRDPVLLIEEWLIPVLELRN